MGASPFQVVIRSPILKFGQEAVHPDASPEFTCLSGAEMVSWFQQWIAGASSSPFTQSRNREAFEISRLGLSQMGSDEMSRAFG